MSKVTPEELIDLKNGKLKPKGKKMIYNPKTRQLEVIEQDESNNDNLITITKEDANMFFNNKIIRLVVPQSILETFLKKYKSRNKKTMHISLISKDSGNVFFVSDNNYDNYEAIITFDNLFDSYTGMVISLKKIKTETIKENVFIFENDIYLVQGYYNNEKTKVILIPKKEEIFSRINGLYETDKLKNKNVTIIGLGSGGSPIALELVKAGVSNFSLIDKDRLEISNIVRHVCGISDVGRYKTLAVKEKMLDKNPYADINTYEIFVDWDTREYVSDIIKKSDIVICATDNRESKMIVNEICVNNNIICIYGGANRRAYGGEVLRVIPNKSLCYECYLEQFSEEFLIDQEISSIKNASQIAYSDIEVPIEPGLSTDILPIAIFIVKLCILELLKGTNHSMMSLYEDFSCPLYIWGNRREYAFKNYTPLSNSIDNLTIMRWYGVEIDRIDNCAICGDIHIDVNNKNIEIFGK